MLDSQPIVYDSIRHSIVVVGFNLHGPACFRPVDVVPQDRRVITINQLMNLREGVVPIGL